MPGKKGNDGSTSSDYWDDNDRVTSRIEGSRSRKKLSTAAKEKASGRVNPNILMKYQPDTGSRYKNAATSKLIAAASKRVGAKIPTSTEIVASKGARSAASARLASMNKKGK